MSKANPHSRGEIEFRASSSSNKSRVAQPNVMPLFTRYSASVVERSESNRDGSPEQLEVENA